MPGESPIAAPPQRPAELPELITAAIIRKRILPVGERTFWRWVSSGTFPRPDISVGGKVRLWRRETVETWIEERSREKK